MFNRSPCQHRLYQVSVGDIILYRILYVAGFIAIEVYFFRCSYIFFLCKRFRTAKVAEKVLHLFRQSRLKKMEEQEMAVLGKLSRCKVQTGQLVKIAKKRRNDNTHSRAPARKVSEVKKQNRVFF